MLLKFQNHIISRFPFLAEKKLFLAVSGGLDSMVLLHLLQKLRYEIAVLHCNFQLRGLESFGDQDFIQKYCEQNNIPVFTTSLILRLLPKIINYQHKLRPENFATVGFMSF